jgi:hypothetical protein
MTQDEWRDGELRSLGVWFGKPGESAGGLLLLLNAGDSDQSFVVPTPPSGGPWMCHFDTARESPELESLKTAASYPLAASSAVLLES